MTRHAKLEDFWEFGKVIFQIWKLENWKLFKWMDPLPLGISCNNPWIFCTTRSYCTLWCQLEDMFQLIGTPQGIERVMVQIKVTPQFFEKYRVKYKAWNNFSWVTVQIQDMPPKWVFVERVLLQIKITPPKLNEHDPIISHGSEVIVTMVVPWSLGENIVCSIRKDGVCSISLFYN